MIRIDKSHEPREWRDYRTTPGVVYQSIPELREALLKEQGYVCAYCMRRIPCKDGNSNEDSRIDHVQSQDAHPECQLDYGNMVICCPGAMSGEFHCDKSKGKRDLSFSPFVDVAFSTIRYSSKDGTIKSDNTNIDNDFNEVLNLNHPLLKLNRKETCAGVEISLGKGQWNISDLRRKLEAWESKGANGRLKPYCGIVIWFLSRKIRQAAGVKGHLP